jgi:hydrogenase maturation protein HypF
VHDLHPEYLSTKYALDLACVELVGVQHHHAHFGAALAEHGELGTAVGAIFDGTGYGTDGTVWGGELLVGDLGRFERAGSLRPVRLPGGERAIRQPWRVACSWLHDALDVEPALPRALRGVVEPRTWALVRALAGSGAASPLTTSVGRLFDAVAALCGVRAVVNYEGQAAIELEAVCDPAERRSYAIDVLDDDGFCVIDPRATIRELVADVEAGAAAGSIASRFHTALARATVEACSLVADRARTDLVVLSGGVFQNRRLAEAVSAGLKRAGLRVIVPKLLPVGDGGISYGQAAIAAHRRALLR